MDLFPTCQIGDARPPVGGFDNTQNTGVLHIRLGAWTSVISHSRSAPHDVTRPG